MTTSPVKELAIEPEEKPQADLKDYPSGEHPSSKGIGAVGGAVAGALLGGLAGPVGAVVGGVAGAVAGAKSAQNAADAIKEKPATKPEE